MNLSVIANIQRVRGNLSGKRDILASQRHEKIAQFRSNVVICPSLKGEENIQKEILLVHKERRQRDHIECELFGDE